MSKANNGMGGAHEPFPASRDSTGRFRSILGFLMLTTVLFSTTRSIGESTSSSIRGDNLGPLQEQHDWPTSGYAISSSYDSASYDDRSLEAKTVADPEEEPIESPKKQSVRNLKAPKRKKAPKKVTRKEQGHVKISPDPPPPTTGVEESDSKSEPEIVPTISHQIDDLCPYCRLHHDGEKSLQCHSKIIRRSQLTSGVTSKKQMVEYFKAAVALSKDKSITKNNDCGRCDPTACTKDDKKYYRIDQVAPKVHFSATHFLKSIMKEHRILPEDVNKIGSMSQTLPKSKLIVLWEFNPSIVKLPANQINKDDGGLYLAAFRISSDQSCLSAAEEEQVAPPDVEKGKAVRPDYVGFAVLDKDLRIVREMVVDIKHYTPKFQDPRLFVLHGQMFVSSYLSLIPLWLYTPNRTGGNRNADSDGIQTIGHLWKENDGNEMTVTIADTAHCSKDQKVRLKGKNLNYFVDDKNQTILEHYPMSAFEDFDLEQRCTPEFMATNNDTTYVRIIPKVTDASRVPSFGTSDELLLGQTSDFGGLPPYTPERGSICCTSVEWQGQKLQLGISHSKTPYRHIKKVRTSPILASNQFFSSFYALAAHAPYNVVARTGRFCFGLPNNITDATDGSVSQHAAIPFTTLNIGGVGYNCPQIHFVSGMTESATDPSKLVVAYGINDCLPRMVVIEKDEVLRMLFNPHSRSLD